MQDILLFCSHDGKYITAGSENQCVYLWRTNNESNNLTVRKDKNSYWEAIKGNFSYVAVSNSNISSVK